jgi:hypothetical protein
MRKNDDDLLASALFVVRSAVLLCVVMIAIITLVDWLSGHDSPVVRAIAAASFELRR